MGYLVEQKDITTHGLKPIGEAVAIAQAKVMEKEGRIPSVDLPVVNPTRSTPGN